MKSIHSIIFLILFFITATFSTVFGQTQESDLRLFLPHLDELGAWHQEDSALVFIGEDLFTLIDGGADIYFEYGFKKVMAAEYLNNQESSIKLELYEMADDSAAFGIFSLNSGHQAKQAQIGNEGVFNSYYLLFWKNSFYVSLTASDTTNETVAEMLQIATRIDQRLGAVGRKPGLVQYLPNSGLAYRTYVKGLLGLSSLYIFDTKNIFEVKEGIVGSYPTHRLFIFKYESGKNAEHAYTNAREILRTSSRFSDLKENQNGLTMTDRKGCYVCVSCTNNFIVSVLAEQRNITTEVCNSISSLLQKH